MASNLKNFLDTSVLVAAFLSAHENHKSSLALVAAAGLNQSFCAAHTVAEVYSVLTRIPAILMRRHRPILPSEALLYLHQIRESFQVVDLIGREYFDTVERLASIGVGRRLIFDGLILTSAAKVNPNVIYTWDLDDFLLVSPPELRDRIRTPPPV